jgi:CRP-like cAMP-binding protein
LFLGPGQIFGEEALLPPEEAPSPPLYSVRCKSAHGEILIISEEDYLKRIFINPRTMKLIEENRQQKVELLQELLESKTSYINMPNALKQLNIDAQREVELKKKQEAEIN